MIYQFGNYTLDLDERKLFRESKVISDDEKTFIALKTLCESSPEVVSKQTLLDTLWPNQMVTEWSLSKLISDIRQLLGDSGKDQDYIKTVRGKGFKMVTKVTCVESRSENSSSLSPNHSQTTVSSELKEAESQPSFFRHAAFKYSLVTLLLFGVISMSIWWQSTYKKEDIQNSYPLRVAVLPVVSESDSQMDDWVRFGVMSLVSKQLEQYTSIQIIPISNVIGQLSSFPPNFLKESNTQVQFKQICQQLGCTHIVSLKYRLENRVPTLSYQLISSSLQSQINEFANTDVIDTTDMMLDHLTLELIPAEKEIIPLAKNYTKDNRVNRDYTIGVHELFNGDLQAARDYLDLAIKRSQNFFWAKAHKAEVEYRAGNLSESASMIEALKTDELNKQSPSASRLYFLDHLYSNVLYSQGKLQASMLLTKQLLENEHAKNDPFLLGNELLNVGSTLQALGKNQEAATFLESARKKYQEAGFGSGEGKVLFNLGNVYLTNSTVEKALTHYRQAREVFIRFGMNGYALMAKHQIATTNLYYGNIQSAEGELRTLIDAYKKIGDSEGEYTALVDLANVSLQKKDYKEAAERIERAIEALKTTEFSYLKHFAFTIAVRSYLQTQQYDKARNYFKQINSEWNEVRPAFALIPAHIKLVEGEPDSALVLGEQIKEKLGSQWTERHQAILDQIKLASEQDKIIPLRY